MSEKGQITIPKVLRDRLGWKAGEVLDVREERGRLIATKAISMDPVRRVDGILKLKRSTDRAIEELRGRPDTV